MKGSFFFNLVLLIFFLFVFFFFWVHSSGFFCFFLFFFGRGSFFEVETFFSHNSPLGFPLSLKNRLFFGSACSCEIKPPFLLTPDSLFPSFFDFGLAPFVPELPDALPPPYPMARTLFFLLFGSLSRPLFLFVQKIPPLLFSARWVGSSPGSSRFLFPYQTGPPSQKLLDFDFLIFNQSFASFSPSSPPLPEAE